MLVSQTEIDRAEWLEQELSEVKQTSEEQLAELTFQLKDAATAAAVAEQQLEQNCLELSSLQQLKEETKTLKAELAEADTHRQRSDSLQRKVMYGALVL